MTTSTNPNLTLNGGLSDISDALGIYGGLQSNSPLGRAIAAANAAKLGGNLAGNPALSNAGGALGSGIGLYSGLEQGGISGYGQAGVDALRLGSYGANLAGNGALGQTLGSAAGDLAIPLSLYNFGKDWQSGATGPDALSGAETGATIGSSFGPIGTLIGGAGGALVGAASSAFGGGKHDPETTALQGLIPEYQQAYDQNPGAATADLGTLDPQQSFETLAGVFDAKNNTPGHSQPIEQTFGRMQEGTFLNDIADQINSGYTSGKVKPGESASDIYSGVVDPWITSQTGGQGILGPQNGEGGVLTGAIQNLIGDYTSGGLTGTTPIGVSGQTDSSLPAFAGMTPQIQAAHTAAEQAQLDRAAAAPPQYTAQEMMGINSGQYMPPSALTQLTQQAMAAHPNQQPLPITQRPVMAQGGHMKKKKLRHYDDGGYVDLTSPDDPELNTPLDMFNSSNVNLDDPFAGAGMPGASNLDNLMNESNFPSAPDSSSSSSSSGKGLSGSLASLLKGLGLSSGTASTLSQLGLTAASLAPIIASLSGKSSGNASQPATTPPAGYAPPSTPFQVPSYSRQYTGPTTSNWSPEQWYKYGEGPEQSFFSNNQLPSMPGLSPPGGSPAPGQPPPNNQIQPLSPGQRPVMAQGGALAQAETHQGHGYVEDPGFGNGTSDDVDAKLSGGEYVMDGGTVSMLGNGSNEAGARQLDQLRQRVRQHAGKSLVKGKQFMKAKQPEAYLGKEK